MITVTLTEAEREQALFELRSGLEVVDETGESPREKWLLEMLIAKLENREE